MNKQRAIFIISFFLLIAFSSHVYAPGGGTGGEGNVAGGTPSGDSGKMADNIQTNLQNGGSFSGTAPAGTPAKFPDGSQGTVSGSVSTSNGELSADSLSYSGATMNNVEGFSTVPGGFKLSSVASFFNAGFSIINGKGISFINGILSVDSYESFTGIDSIISTNGINLTSEKNKIYIEQADNLISDTITFDDIEYTKFTIYGDAVKAETNSSIIITDADNNLVNFTAINENGSVVVTKDKPARYIFSKGILKNTRGNITEAILGNNTVVVEMGMLGFQCMEISPVGSYYYNEDFRKDFGINIPTENNETYKLCLRKLAGEEFSNTDGMVDYVARKITANKIINYLRHVFENTSFVNFQLKNVYEAKSMDNHVEMQLDREMVFVELLNLSNSMTDYNISVARLGMHEIIETDSARFEKMRFNEQYPNVIKIYATNYSDTALQVEGKTVTQIGKTNIKLLTVNDEDVDKAEFLLINYWIKRWKSLMDYLGS